MQSAYSKIINFGPNQMDYNNNPLSYCMNSNLDNEFTHGAVGDLYGQHSAKCQMFMSDYCAKKWDGNCEVASMNNNTQYPNNIGTCGAADGVECMGLTAGDVLVQNTASKKYLVENFNCYWEYEPFDPTVANSPLVRRSMNNSCNTQGNGYCVPVYEVDPATIDQDPVMDKILMKPKIAIFILVNIYNTMKRKGTLTNLQGTKLGRFFSVNKDFFEKEMYKNQRLR